MGCLRMTPRPSVLVTLSDMELPGAHTQLPGSCAPSQAYWMSCTCHPSSPLPLIPVLDFWVPQDLIFFLPIKGCYFREWPFVISQPCADTCRTLPEVFPAFHLQRDLPSNQPILRSWTKAMWLECRNRPQGNKKRTGRQSSGLHTNPGTTRQRGHRMVQMHFPFGNQDQNWRFGQCNWEAASLACMTWSKEF